MSDLDSTKVSQEIQALLDSYFSNINTWTSAANHYIQFIQSPEETAIPLDRELALLGVQSKTLTENISSSVTQIRKKFLEVFDSLTKQDFHNWANDQECFDIITELYHVHKAFQSVFTTFKDIVSEYFCHIIQPKSFENIIYTTFLLQQTTETLETLLAEFKLFKSGQL